jgi:hypothetical protein
MFDALLFCVLDPLYFGGCNFFIFNEFLTILSVSDASRRGVQVLFGYEKQ